MIFGKNRSDMWLIAGLGNPGLQYEKTRHNAGFMAADRLAEKHGAQFNKHKSEAVYADFKIGDNRILLVKPQTYMNNSGRAVSALLNFYKIPTDRLIVMFDDITLDIGKLRLRRKGSYGGHNGIKDIIELTGTDEIMRIKIGVGERENRDYDLKDWVLGKIPTEQMTDLNNALDRAALAAEEIIIRGIDSAMNKYNG
ncbi:MAG: aminoacyl-tRNA hydrolase [Acutalibacteraceae bacterium]